MVGSRMVQQDIIFTFFPRPRCLRNQFENKTVDCETKAKQYHAKKRQLYQQVHQLWAHIM